MKLLAVSTSAKTPSAALLLDDDCIDVKRDTTGRPHSVSLMPLVDALLCERGLTPADIDLFAVDVGPGSFTGVRIGVSAVNAMAFALNKKVVAVPSLSALRHRARDTVRNVVMLDARNGNGYAAVYDGETCVLEPCACVQNEVMETYFNDNAELVGDCFGKTDQCDATLVILEALAMLREKGDECKAASAVPLYLRPSQAERMKGAKE